MKKITFLLAFLIISLFAGAANFYWIGGASGAWNVPANWSSISKTGPAATRLPARVDQAIFDTTALGPNYSVNVTGLDIEVAGLRILPGISVNLVGLANSIKISYQGNTTGNAIQLAGNLDDGGNTLIVNGTIVVTPAPVANIIKTVDSTSRGKKILSLANVTGLSVGQFLSGRNIFSGSQVTDIDVANNKVTISYPVSNIIGIDSAISFWPFTGTITGSGKLVVKGSLSSGAPIQLNANANYPMLFSNLQIGDDTAAASVLLRGTTRVSGKIEVVANAVLYSQGSSIYMTGDNPSVNVAGTISINNRRNGLAAAYDSAQTNQPTFLFKKGADIRSLVFLAATSTILDSAIGANGAAQSIFVAPLNYGNLVIYGSGGIQATSVLANGTANGNVTINGTLTLMSDTLTVAQGDTLTIASGKPIVQSGSSLYVNLLANGTNSRYGTLRVKNISSGYTFPVGSVTGYSPITVNTAGGANDIQVTTLFRSTATGFPLGLRLNAADSAKSLNNFWRVKNNAGVGSYTAAVGWINAMEPTDFAALSNIGVASNVNNVWGVASIFGDNNANTASSFSISDTLVFLGVAQASQPLPVIIEKVGINAINNQPVIKWNVANQSMVAYYVVEKSVSNGAFRAVKQVAQNGQASYQITDTNNSGTAVYRIKIVTTNGKTVYSAALAYTVNVVNGGIKVYPTLVKGNTVNLSFTKINGNAQVRVIETATGRVAFSKNYTVVSDVENYQLQLPTVAKGHYQLQVISGANTYSQNMILE